MEQDNGLSGRASLVLALVFVSILAVVKGTRLRILFDQEIVGEGIQTLLRTGTTDNPKLQFYYHYVLPVQRTTLVFAGCSLVLGWFWLLKSFRQKHSWQQLAGALSGLSLTFAALAYFDLLFTKSDEVTVAQMAIFKYLVDPWHKYGWILVAVAIASAFSGFGRWRIAFVFTLALILLLWWQ